MATIIQPIIASLEEFSEKTRNGYSDDRTFIEIWGGWNMPALTRHDLAEIPKSYAEKLRKVESKSTKEDLENLEEIPERIAKFNTNTFPYLYNGNGATSVPLFLVLMEWIGLKIDSLYRWETLQDNKAIPTALARRIRSIQTDIDEIEPDKEKLRSQIQLINDATEAAESLPIDLQRLKESRNKMDSYVADAVTAAKKIQDESKKSEETAKTIESKALEAEKLVQQCNEAYRITTTAGLAGSFDQRAKKLQASTWIWVVALALVLAAGALIGSHRFELLTKTINKDSGWGEIVLQLLLSLLSIGAPVWFAWLSTKQITQRFRLAEDYAYKASVAKAYEGYRREAARIDEAFEARLFSSALTRLEEAPLRLVDSDPHGSPWQELISSDAFQKALSQIPELRDKFIDIAKESVKFLPTKKIINGKKIENEDAN